MSTANAMDSEAWAGFLGRKWALKWAGTDRTFDQLTDRLSEIVAAEGFADALDVGCGAGGLVLQLASEHPGARFTGIDISQELIDVARERSAAKGHARFYRGDAANWRPDRRQKFDLLLARHVVMFFDNPARTMRHLASLATDDARMIFTCFRSNEENGWVNEILAQLPGAPAPRLARGEPSPLAFADPEWVKELLLENGWRDVATEPFDYPMVMGEGEDPVDDALAYLHDIGPASFAVRTFAMEELKEFRLRMRTMLRSYLSGGKVALPGATWIVSARKA